MSGGESAAPASSRLGSISLSVWQYGRNAALSAAEYVTPVSRGPSACPANPRAPVAHRAALRHRFASSACAFLPSAAQVLKESQFAAKGVLTPEEFVEAGDMLVLRCPTWQWQAGDPSKARPFLPPDKQFLLTRNVPCQKRACTLGDGADDEKLIEAQGEDGDDEGWVATHTAHAAKVVADDDAPDMDAPPQPPPPAPPAAGAEAAAAQLGNMSIGGAAGSASSAAAAAVEAGLEECDELEEYDPSALDMGAATSGGSGSAVVRTRTYDASMSYDKYYQVRAVCPWLPCTGYISPKCVPSLAPLSLGAATHASPLCLAVRPRLAVRLFGRSPAAHPRADFGGYLDRPRPQDGGLWWSRACS